MSKHSKRQLQKGDEEVMDVHVLPQRGIGAGAKKSRAAKLNWGLFTSASDEWETPQNFFDAVNEIFHCTLDVCATPLNAKCARYYTKKEDGLSQAWEGVCWMNPPYGREISVWIKKAYESSLNGAVVVCLLPARTDTRWWHDYVLPHAKCLWFIRGRLRFSCKGYAPFPSVLVVFELADSEAQE